jgi:uncharacterized membrane protein
MHSKKSETSVTKNGLILLALVLIFLLLPIKAFAVQPFNVEIELPSSYQNVNPGTDVWFTVKLLNLANTQRLDVTLSYDIFDSKGQSVAHNSKTVAIETQASFVADLKIPKSALPGDYSVNVAVNSTLGESTAKTSLKVSSPKTYFILYYIGAAIALLLLLIFLIVKSRPLIAKLTLRAKIARIVHEKLRKK